MERDRRSAWLCVSARRLLMLAVLCTAATWTLAAASASAGTLPVITGNPVQGETLSATWADGVSNFSYQWSDGQTGQTITLSAADVGQSLSVTVSADDVNGQTISAPSGTVTVLPANATVPVINGIGQLGATLTVTTGTWNNGASSFGYEWESCDTSGNNCSPITNVPDATTSSYMLQPSDVGHTVLAVVTDLKSAISAQSGADGPILPPPPADQTAPGISGGPPQQGVALTVSHGEWSNGPTSYQYAWQDCSTSTYTSCSAVGGNANAYTPTASDVGNYLSVEVTAANQGGQATVTTASVGPVQAAPVTTQNTTPSSPPAQATVVSVPVLGTITSTMQWAFFYTPRYTVVRSLVLNGAASGATVVIKCQGRGCPFGNRTTVLSAGKRCGRKSHAGCFTSGTFNLTPSFGGRHLGVGARITISIVRASWVGKSYRFTVRARRGPRVQIGCLAPGGGAPDVGCS